MWRASLSRESGECVDRVGAVAERAQNDEQGDEDRAVPHTLPEVIMEADRSSTCLPLPEEY
jgi:hypothetical protein